MKKILTKDILNESLIIMNEKINNTKREGLISKIKDTISKKLNSLDTEKLKSFMDQVMTVREEDEEPLKNLIDVLFNSDLVDNEELNSLINEEEIFEGKNITGTIGKGVLVLGILFLGVIGAIDMRHNNEINNKNKEIESYKVKEELKKMVIPQNVLDYLKTSDSYIYDGVLNLASCMYFQNTQKFNKKDLYDYVLLKFSKTNSFFKILEDTNLNEKELAEYISIFVYNMFEDKYLSGNEEVYEDNNISNNEDNFNVTRIVNKIKDKS